MHGLFIKKVHVLNQDIVTQSSFIWSTTFFGIVDAKLSRPASRCYLIIGITGIILFYSVIVIIQFIDIIAVIVIIEYILLHCCYFDYVARKLLMLLCLLYDVDRFALIWVFCNCETGWRFGRWVPSCNAQGMAGLHLEDPCCQRWSLWYYNGAGWFVRAWRCVISVRSWAFWPVFHIKY